MKLVKYRDAGMNAYTYFWVREEGSGVISPYFNSEKEAENWVENIRAGADQQGDDDKDYSESTQEKYDEFVKKRNYPL